MVSPTSESPERGRSEEAVGNPDWSPWALLLIVPIVIPLIPGIFNRVEPVVLGMPAFYWLQLAYVPLSAVFTAVVYFKTRKR